MFLACSRFIFLLTFLASFLVLSASLYLEYGSGLEPCSLCLVQRFFLTAVCVRPSHLPNPVKPGHGVHLNLGGHQF